MLRGWPIPLLRRPASRRLVPSTSFLATWRLFTLALVLLGFFALVFTGELGPFVIVLFLAFWTVGVIRPKPPAWWRPWMGILLFWGVLTLIGLLALQFKFISLLYLLLLLGAVKCLTLREPIDHIQAVLISFVMLLACSIITNSILYIVFMLGFIMLVMLDLICYTVAQEANRATAWFDPAADGGARAQERVLFRRVFASTMGVAVLVLITAHLLFFIMPHYATQRGYRGFSPRDEPDEAVSGFSENLDLNALSRISLDNTQIMEIKVAWEGDDRDLPPPDQLWLRGSNLAVFDAQGWHTEFPARLKQSDEWRVINLPYSVSERRPVLRQEIRQHVGRLRRLFGAGDAFSMEYGGLVVSHLNWNAEAVDIVMRQSFGGDFSYKVNSVIPPDGLITLGRLARAQARLPESAAALPPAERIERMRQFDPAIPRPDAALFLRESERRLYTRLPRMPLTQIVRDVAAQRVRGRSEIESILNLHRWFSAAFEYSLVPDTPPGMHPLEGFLLHTHKGHCEYFASAMVLLLRAKGIPARVVTGYYTTEYSPETSVFRVRQSDAHAWCELWQDALGWLPIDPTPPFYRGRASLDTYEPPFWKSLRDDLRSMWQIYILDYSSNAKAELLAELFQQPFGERLGGLVDRLRAVAVNRFSDRSLARLDFLKAGEQSLLPLARSLLAVFLLIALWGIYRRRRRRLLAADPALSPVAFMNELLARLQQLGWPRLPGQTPAELIAAVERQTDGRWNLLPTVDLYHRCRYAGLQPSAQELISIQETLRALRS